jgi:hypothetical protein
MAQPFYLPYSSRLNLVNLDTLCKRREVADSRGSLNNFPLISRKNNTLFTKYENKIQFIINNYLVNKGKDFSYRTVSL